ncbi:hypothetical protein BG004_004231 [Podila humilis]|nr:hypothetical protein BG004_004231 [Podila humilis]
MRSSIAVPCAHSGCTRKDRVVAKCDHPPGGCDKVFCLKHRQPNDHNCAKLIERALTIKEAKTDLDMKKEVIANTFSKDSTLSSSAAALTTGNKPGIMTPEEKAAIAKAKAEQARAAIAEAKAKVAARAASSSTTTPPLCSKGGAIDPGPGGSRAGTIGSTSPQPKVKKASRVVSLIKLRKVAQGEDKIPTNARVHVYIRSPIFPQLDDKAVFVDKSWTVGRCLDKIVECLKIAVPKNEPFDAQKRLSIFHAKELEDVPALLSMQDRVQTIAKIESGDLFYLALANHSWDTNVTS